MLYEVITFSKSLEKGLKILSLFNRDVPFLTQTEVANRLGMNMTSTFRYINTLVEMGYLDKDELTKRVITSYSIHYTKLYEISSIMA